MIPINNIVFRSTIRTTTRRSAIRAAATGFLSHAPPVARQYVSRAHPPEEKPAHPVGDALKLLLDSVEERKEKRVQKWEKNADKRKAKGVTVSLGLV